MSRFEIHLVQWTPEKISRFWAYLTSTPTAEGSYFSGLFGERILALTARYIPSSTKKIVDYGCGPGFLVEQLLRSGLPAEGLEFSNDSAQSARNRCQSYPTFGGVTHIRELPSPIQTGTVDVLFLVEVIEHLVSAQRDATLREIQRLLSVGGIFIVTTPHREDLRRVSTVCPDCGCVFHPWQHVDSFDARSLALLLSQYGFEQVACMPTNLGARWYGRALRAVRKFFLGDRALQNEPHLIYVGRRTEKMMVTR